MKILMITPFPPQISGGSKASYYFYRYLKQIYDYQIKVLSYQKVKNKDHNIYSLGLKGDQSWLRGLLFIILGFFRGLLILIRFKPDIIYSKQLMTPSITALFLAKISRKPLVSHTAGPDIQNMHFMASNVPLKLSKIYYLSFSWLRYQVLKYSSAIICNCRADYEALKNLYKNSKSIIIYNGLRYKKFKFKSNLRLKIRKKYNIKKNKKVIAYVGQANIQKQPDLLLKIAQENIDLCFLVVGPNLAELNEFGDISKNVVITGPVYNNIEGYYSAADLLILPSKYEGLSNSMLEALSCNLPIIVTPVGEAKYLIKHKVNGILSKEADFSFWIRELLNNPPLYRKLKKNSRKLIKRKFDWCESSKKISILFNKIKKKNYES